MSHHRFQTLDEFLNQSLRATPNATGELSALLWGISLAAQRVSRAIAKAGLADMLGNTGKVNVQGEEVKKLDEFANAQFMDALQHGPGCAGFASEELADFIAFDDAQSRQSKYVCLFDPLDGSGNIETNISTGTIFSIYRRVSESGAPVCKADFLQKGIKQVAAGYIVYGSSTLLVYATRCSVNGFTLDPSLGAFCLSYPDLKCPEVGETYSVNHGNFLHYSPAIQAYITHCQHGNKLACGPYTQRYTGSMVADVHCNLVKGGIFLYPATKEHPAGKLRLMYECNPIAFILEVTGGRSSNDEGLSILGMQPTSLHQRTPFFAGSKNMMTELETFLTLANGGGK